MSEKISITKQALFFGAQTIQKLLHNPAEDKHGYHLNKLFRKLQSAQKLHGPTAQKFLNALTEEYAEKDEAGKAIVSPQGEPKVSPEKREEYDNKREEFLDQTIEVDAPKLPLEYFAHIKKTPLDWDVIGQISDASPAKLDQASKPDMQSALRAIQG